MTVEPALDRILRRDRGRLLAALIARTGDFQRAEDALQEAAASALVHWARCGVPTRPEGWLLRVALRKAIDGYRQAARQGRHAEEIARLAEDEAALVDVPDIADERLRLIFTCCHPALEPKTRVALTLRTLCDLSTADVAAVFLDTEVAMGQRLSRAKAKIAQAKIPFRIPEPQDFADRINSVLTVIYLAFTSGYAAGAQGGVAGKARTSARDLCHEALYLARLVDALSPGTAEVEGCLALLLLTHARAAARASSEGETVPLTLQDRRLWDSAMLHEGQEVLARALSRRQSGPFQIKAAIAACQMDTPPDWPQIVALYGALMAYEQTPVTRLNRAVAIFEVGQHKAAMAEVESLADDLADYQPFHAVRADFLARQRRYCESRAAYDRAIRLATNPSDVSFLLKRQAKVP